MTSPAAAPGWRTDQLRLAEVAAPGGAEVTEFHRASAGYAPAPLTYLHHVAAELGVRSVAVKDESDRFGLPAFKILGASWAVEQALRTWPDTHTLVAASAGNHGRAVARCAAQRGLACRVHLPRDASPQRAVVIAAEGALVRHADGDYESAIAAADADARGAGVALISDFGRDADLLSPGWVVDGYVTLFREIAQQAARPVDVLVVPMGVGSLAAAAVRWAAHEGRCRVVGVEPVTAACVTASLLAGHIVTVPTPGTSMSGLDCATPSAPAWPSLRDGLTATVTVDDGGVHAAMRELARAGLTIGDCGAATIAALRRLAADAALRDGLGLAEANVVCLGTEGATDPDAYRSVVG